jgi:hypothetical protein
MFVTSPVRQILDRVNVDEHEAARYLFQWSPLHMATRAESCRDARLELLGWLRDANHGHQLQVLTFSAPQQLMCAMNVCVGLYYVIRWLGGGLHLGRLREADAFAPAVDGKDAARPFLPVGARRPLFDAVRAFANPGGG